MDDVWTYALPLVGMVLVVAVVADVTTTALVISKGPGWITKALSKGLWSAVLWVQGRGARWVLPFAGPVILLTIIASWVVLMILGWSLVFGAEGSLLSQGETVEPAWGRVHYSASLILGRGTGDVGPSGGFWRFAEMVAAAIGVAFVGVALAYVLPVINAVVQRRTVATMISALGGNPVEILERAWNGRDTGDLDLHLIGLTPEIALLSQRHLAYPVISYFHSSQRAESLAPRLVVLDETLTLLGWVLEPDQGCSRTAVRPCRSAVTNFLESMEHMGVHAQIGVEVPRPDLTPLRQSGIELRSLDEIEEAYDDLEDRRELLAAFLRHDAGDPEEVQATVDSDEVKEEERGSEDGDDADAAEDGAREHDDDDGGARDGEVQDGEARDEDADHGEAEHGEAEREDAEHGEAEHGDGEDGEGQGRSEATGDRVG